VKKFFLWTGGVLLGVFLLLAAITYFVIPHAEERITTAKTPRPEITLKRFAYIAPPMGGDDNWLYAELDWNGRHDRELILYTGVLVLGPITWPRPDKMVVCVDPSTIKDSEFHGEVTLTAGGRTAKLYTELKGDCPGEIRQGNEPL
jgi:hypothetical protein